MPRTDAGEIRGEIEFRHLTFTYPTVRSDADGAKSNGNAAANKPVLQDISLRVPAGSILAIVGPTGSGKSTLAALIARLWEAPPGTLLIDGRPIREWPLETLRRAVGFVPQDTFLFSETLRENVAFGVDSATDEEIHDAADVASIAAEIEEFPAQFDTMVGERGITLSGGQKQRTAIARAVIRDPKILILDDSLSSVDTGTEERILQRLDAILRQRTTILISHRVSTVQHADQIVGPARRAHRRTRHARRTSGARRLLRRSVPETIARGRAGTRMSDFREEEALGKAYDSQLLRRLMTYLRPYKWSVVFAVFLTLLVGPLDGGRPLPVRIHRRQLHRPRR